MLLSNVTSPGSIISPINYDNAKRFNILYRRQFSFSDNGKQMHVIKFNKNLNMHIRYDGNAGTIADLTTNSLFILCVGNQASNVPTISFINRLYYLDN